jgi:hypothetical protein
MMEGRAKSAGKSADAEQAKALAIKAKDAAAMQKLKLEGEEKVEKIKAKDRAKLIELERRARSGDKEALKKMTETLKLNAPARR